MLFGMVSKGKLGPGRGNFIRKDDSYNRPLAIYKELLISDPHLLTGLKLTLTWAAARWDFQRGCSPPPRHPWECSPPPAQPAATGRAGPGTGVAAAAPPAGPWWRCSHARPPTADDCRPAEVPGPAGSGVHYGSFYIEKKKIRSPFTTVVDPKTLYLDQELEICPNLNQSRFTR